MKLNRVDYLKAKEHGISEPLLRKRVNELKWDKERAMTKKPNKDTEKIYYYRLCMELKIVSLRTYYRRLKSGWEPKDACMSPPGKPWVYANEEV